MGLVRDDEHDRPLNRSRAKSIATLFNELIENVNTSRSYSSSTRTTSTPITNEASLPPIVIPSPPPMQAPNSTHTTSKSKYTSSNLSQRILEGLQSHYHHDHQPHEPSPTDSHHRSHPRSHSRHRSSRSSETISAMFLIATERLSQETSRANEAERQSSEILARFKIVHEAKQRLELDLQRVKDELGLYKTQLDRAQNEIHRAQEIVDKVDQQRVDAEDEACRGREKIRKLTEARVIESAMEEGRRLGYEEGMRQGRLMMQAGDNGRNQLGRYYRRSSFRSARDDDDDDQVSYFSYTQEEQRSTEPSRSPTNPASFRSSSRRRRTSDARHTAPPISPISTSHSIPTASSHNQASSAPKPGNNANHPEHIAIQPHPTENSSPIMPIRPISVRNHSPTVSHRSFNLPPDGYIPTVGANLVISLPPPHELSIPVPPAGGSQPSATATNSGSKQASKQASTSRSYEYAERESRNRTPKSVDGDSINHSTLSRQPRTNSRNKRPTHTGLTSEASTLISESSLLGSPDGIGRKENTPQVDYFNEGTRGLRASTQPERMDAKWRCVNADMTPSPSPAPFLDRYNESASRMYGNFTIERPTTTDPTQRSQSRLSRRPREIVLPTPSIGSLLNPGVAQDTAGQWHNENEGSSSTGYRDARPEFSHRSVSNITVPGIEIVTPSSHTSSTISGRTVVDPVLLTPESANRPIPIPAQATEAPPNSSLGLHFNQPSSMSMSGDEYRIAMVLPDNNFPPGFVPLSPIPGLKNLDSYPSGFAPNNTPKLQDEYPDGRLPSQFSYPSSPIVRSGV